ncbi:type I restriction enzyme, S subunit [Desulfomicrobium norvegicum]|uniref:Type I restriction enzyme, S subunit n=1 Tax=Desulfomicrobium norvegicum (strain DSM 1741 / NCIMB 8310) TaxID=52561 RepID=A0A8G2C6B7_DESNO|nr:restriction endonuclease subunit S [Desulfomicrobium norvegicum]SFM23792.1 type I restriction enzyme, S subunit [Desulfomicrobium norvegicum]
MKWPTTKLGEVCRVTPGFAFKSESFQSIGIPVVKIGSIRDDYTVDVTDAQCLPMDLFSDKLQKFVLKDRDIVLAMTGATAGKLGRIRTSCDLLLNQRVAKIESTKANPDFIWFALSSKKYRELFFSIAGGAAQPNMSGSQIESVEIPLPPIQSQQCIARILSAYDNLIANNQSRMELLEKAARSIYEEWFVRLRFPGHEHTPFQDDIPKKWERKALITICPDLREAVLPTNLEPGTPYIGLEHMPRRSITLFEWGTSEDVTSTKLKYQAGDILFGKIRPYFHKVGFALTDGVTSSDAIVLRPIDNLYYIFSLLTVSSDWFVSIVSKTAKEGSKMPRADWKLMEKHTLSIPPRSLLEALNETVQPILDQLRTLALQNQKLRIARDLLLPRLMSGEIEV